MGLATRGIMSSSSFSDHSVHSQCNAAADTQAVLQAVLQAGLDANTSHDFAAPEEEPFFSSQTTFSQQPVGSTVEPDAPLQAVEQLPDSSLEQEALEQVLQEVHTLLGTSRGTFIEASVFGCGQRLDRQGQLLALQDFELTGSFLVFREHPVLGPRSRIVLFHPHTGLYLRPNALQWRQILNAEPCFGVLLHCASTKPTTT